VSRLCHTDLIPKSEVATRQSQCEFVDPVISFIVPAHNEEQCLGRALEAIHDSADAVGQTYEVIVVDDASTDATAEVARQHRATLLSVNHRQIAATRNAGGRAAQGDRLFFVDADTFISPQLVAAALRALDKGAVGGGAPVGLEPPVPLYARLLVFLFSICMRIAELSGGAFMFATREAFHAVGGFDERLYAAEDPAFSSALKREGRFALLWTPALTSGRRARTTSGLAMIWFFLGLAFLPLRKLTRRSSVEKMWYESDREGDEQRYGTLAFKASNFAALVLILLFLSGPLWVIPLPESLSGGWLGTFKYAVQVLQCHIALVLLPCAYLLARVLLRQKRWIERVKLIVLIAVCLWIGLTSLREVYWIWREYLLWIAEYFTG
jgi:glycosyltransferase involved in cell wall biosynthesis